ncbi:MAG: flippase-like domain-containing protein, partial [Clostridia bacterium]|nr:flippase-like domain-containing protein [Clostridia bacterium]
PKVVWWLISIAYKLKIVKSRELAYTNSMRSILEYQRSIKYYMKSFWTTLISFVLSIGIIALKGLIPYLIYLMFVPNPTLSYFTILILYNACELITMFSPLPGGSGVAELSFTTLFFAMFPETYIFWAMIFFRVFTYYIYIAQGMLVHIYDIVIGNKLNDKYLSRKNSR